MLVDIFGDYPQVKVLDFLIENRDHDYSLSDIARGSNVARPTLYEIVDGLIELGVIEETRRIGNARMFGMNKKSPIVKSLTRFDLELSKKLVRKELTRQDK
jgi:Fe2+ or Zn2+ uptake regulation protein